MVISSSLLLFLFRPLACLVFLEPLAPCCVASCLFGPLALVAPLASCFLFKPLALLYSSSVASCDLFSCGLLPILVAPLALFGPLVLVVVGPLALMFRSCCASCTRFEPLALRSTAACFDRD